MNIQKRCKNLLKTAAGAATAAIVLATGIVPAASATPAATAQVFAHPPTSGDCTSCHPKPTTPSKPRRGH